MFSPVVIIESLKRRHFLVFITAAVSITLKVQIALSSSIFHSALMQRSRPVDVQITDFFTDEVDVRELKPDLAPNSYAAALAKFDLEPPFGVSQECAYQTFTSLDAYGKAIQPTLEEPLTVTVDGLFADTECLLLEDYKIAESTLWYSEPGDQVIELRFEDCEEILIKPFSLGWPGSKEIDLFHANKYADGNDRPCSSLPQQHTQFVYTVMQTAASPQNASMRYLHNFQAVLCSSLGWISKVEVIDDGISRTVSRPIGLGANTTFNIDPWRLLSHSDTLGTTFRTLLGENGIDGLSMNITKRELNSPSDDLRYQSRELSVFVKEVTRNYTIMVAHDQLRKEAQDRVTGTRMETVDRLRINLGVCVAMTSLSAIGAISALFALRWSLKTSRCYHRDPATVLGSIINICCNPQSLKVTGLVVAELPREAMAARKASWSQGAYSPPSLKPNLRILLVAFVLSLILGLSLTLWRSRQHEGLITVNGKGYWPLLWQSLPTLLMLGVSLFLGSVDIAIRRLATLSDILAQTHHSAVVDLSLLDMLGLRAVYHSIHLRNPAIAISHILAALCGFLPIISSLLFSTENIPNLIDIIIDEGSWFGSRLTKAEDILNLRENRRTLGHLSLLRGISNLTSPRYTYQDLVFPTFEINDQSWGPNSTAKVSISAARLSPICAQLQEDDFSVITSPASLEVRRDVDCPDSSPKPYLAVRAELVSSLTREGELLYFGGSQASPSNPVMQQTICNDDKRPNKTSPAWIDRTYAWGSYSKSSGLDHLSVWHCNYTWVDITTDLYLVWSGGHTAVNQNRPPVWDASSSRPWTPPFSIPIVDINMFETQFSGSRSTQSPSTWVFGDPGQVSRVHLGVSNEFAHILEPYGPIMVEDFGILGRDEQVLEALNSNLAFITAQLANVERRLDLDKTSDSTPPSAPGQHSRGSITGTITDNTRQRMVQNPAVTFTLIAILSLVVAVHVWVLISEAWWRSLKSRGRRAWALSLELRGVAPSDFGSVNMMSSLLQGSNCAGVLPKNAHLMPAEELHQRLAGKEFRLGWFHDMETGADVYTLGVLNEGSLVYLGSSSGVGES